MAWNLRVRGPSGQVTLTGVRPDMSVKEFQELISSKTNIAPELQDILSGFPPRPLVLPDDRAGTQLSSLMLANGDTLTLRVAAAAEPSGARASQPQPDTSKDEELARSLAAALAASIPAASIPAASAAPAPAAAATASAARASGAPSTSASYQPPATSGGVRGSSGYGADQAAGRHVTNSSANNGQGPAPTSITLPDGTAVVRRIIDSDNSCLFNAVGYVMERSRQHARQLRQVIVDAVRSDPFTYNEGFLGMDHEEYCKWILSPDKWGGAIELSILSRFFGREIAAHDIQTKRVDIYGQEQGYSERVMLLYDGLHYDAMAVAAFEGAPEELDVTIYDVPSANADMIEQGAAKLVEAAHKARAFTDTANFTLRCGVCQIGLKGEKEAVAHAKSTGHTNFTEY